MRALCEEAGVRAYRDRVPIISSFSFDIHSAFEIILLSPLEGGCSCSLRDRGGLRVPVLRPVQCLPALSCSTCFVIGGGINGCGIARDAVGRGYSVILAEMNEPCERHLFRLHQTHPWRSALSRTLRVSPRARSADGARDSVAQRAAHHLADAFRPAFAQGAAPSLASCGSGSSSTINIGGRKRLPKTRTLDMRSDPAGKPLKSLLPAGL